MSLRLCVCASLCIDGFSESSCGGYSYSQDSAYYGDSAPAILQNENNKVIPDQTHERSN